MIRKVKIENFKSIRDLEIELGSFNILIGNSGSGKTNILEGIAMGMAASQDKLDLAFLQSQGLRVMEPRFMRSAFEHQAVAQEIIIQLDDGQKSTSYRLVSENKSNPKWIDLNHNFRHNALNHLKEKTLNLATEVNKQKSTKKKKTTEKEVWSLVDQWIDEQQKQKKSHTFLIYQPDKRGLLKNKLRSRSQSLNIYGEGLFALLDKMAEYQPAKLKEIRRCLEGLDWLEDFYAYLGAKGEPSLKIKDAFVSNPITYFPPQATPQGFLFLLFYLSIFMSEESPDFFAVEDLAATLPYSWIKNMMPLLIKLSQEHQKQVLITSNNIAWLKTFTWKKGEIKVFQVYRNEQGHTLVEEVESKQYLKEEGNNWEIPF